MDRKYVKKIMSGLAIVIMTFFLWGCDNKIEDVTNEDIILESTSESNENVIEVVSENTFEERTEENHNAEVVQEVNEESDKFDEAVNVETSEEILNEEVVEENIPAYTVEPMTATMYAQRAVNVRKGPGTDYEKIGGLSTNQEVAITGKASTGWYEISYNGSVGYVSNNYLGDNRVMVETTPVTQGTTNSNETIQIVTDDWTWEELTTFTVSDVYLVPDMLTLVNGHRSANGVPELTWNSAKEQEALERAKEISQNFSHQGNPADVENIAFNDLYGDANTFYMQYYNSPPHNQGMLKYSADATGISMVSATCVTSNAAGGKKYYNVILIYMDYPDNWSRVDWDNLGGTGN